MFFICVAFLVTLVSFGAGGNVSTETVSTANHNATIPGRNDSNGTFTTILLTTTSETPIPLLVTTMSPKDFAKKPKKRLYGIRRAAPDKRSTSSSSGDKSKNGLHDKKGTREKDISLDLSSLSDIPSDSKGIQDTGITKKGEIKSSAERRGWRKWHRKCQGCPDLRTRWREPKINWICGAYQRARRSFKSECAMHFRNCQDGTMFVKISDHRCPDDQPGDPLPHGDHFFYEYKVDLTGETSKSSSKGSGGDDDDASKKSLDTFSLSADKSESKKKMLKKKQKKINYRRSASKKAKKN